MLGWDSIACTYCTITAPSLVPSPHVCRLRRSVALQEALMWRWESEGCMGMEGPIHPHTHDRYARKSTPAGRVIELPLHSCTPSPSFVRRCRVI